ncbi:MAG: alginate lyase family protein [Planctomycetes bacterium]|nr:alginate lyase family protein [Planctomycetota bacterium]
MSKNSASNWKDVRTARECAQKYPERMEKLLSSLDLSRSGFKKVRSARNSGDIAMACEAVLAYYRKSKNAGWLRISSIEETDKTDPRAEKIINDILTKKSVSAKVPRGQNGHLDWGFMPEKGGHQYKCVVNRHHHIGRLLNAYRTTGNPDYAKCIDRNLRDWIIASEGDPVPWNTHALEPANRLPIWARLFYGFLDDKHLSDSTRLLMLACMPAHVQYLLHNPGGNNWVTMTMRGVLTAGICWPEFKKSSLWRKEGLEKVQQNITNTVYPDGAQAELTSHYLWVSLSRYEAIAELLQNSRIELPENFAQKTEKLWNYLVWTMRPEGYGLLNNDSDRDHNAPRIRRAAEQYGRDDWLYIATNGKEGEKPEGQPSRFFPWAGQLVMRNGWQKNAQWSFFDVGPWGAGHQHNDKLHLSVASGGRDLLVDSGRFWYEGGPIRRYAISSPSHNVVLVDGYGQLPTNPRAKKAIETGSVQKHFDFAYGSYENGFGGEPKNPDDVKVAGQHRRAVLYLRDRCWLVFDRIICDGEHEIRPLWHFHPDCTVETDGSLIRTTDAGEGNLRLQPVSGPDWNLKIIKGREEPAPQGWYCESSYTEWYENPTAVYWAQMKQEALFAWLLVPGKNEIPPVKLDPLETPEGSFRFRLKFTDQTTEIAVSLSDQPVVPLSNDHVLRGHCAVLSEGKAPRAACGRIEGTDGSVVHGN